MNVVSVSQVHPYIIPKIAFFSICQKDSHFQLLKSILQLLTLHVSGVQDKEHNFAQGRLKNNNRRGRERKREQCLNQ